MAKRRKIITSIIFAALFISVFLLFLGITKENRTVEVLIPKGASPYKISKILKDSEVISSKSLFLALVKCFLHEHLNSREINLLTLY